MRVAINGFGRIGRTVFRANLVNPTLDIVAINDLGDPKMTAYLLKYDSNYGVLDKEVTGEAGKLTVDGKEYVLASDRDPEKLPWAELDIDLVIDCTGVFRDSESAGKHLKAGAKRVIVSAPCKADIHANFVMGVNHTNYDPEKHFLVSNVSCTHQLSGASGQSPPGRIRHQAWTNDDHTFLHQRSKSARQRPQKVLTNPSRRPQHHPNLHRSRCRHWSYLT